MANKIVQQLFTTQPFFDCIKSDFDYNERIFVSDSISIWWFFCSFSVTNWWPIWMRFWRHRIRHLRWKNSKINLKKTWLKNGTTSSVRFGIQKNWTNGSPNWLKRSKNSNNCSCSQKGATQPKMHGKWSDSNSMVKLVLTKMYFIFRRAHGHTAEQQTQLCRYRKMTVHLMHTRELLGSQSEELKVCEWTTAALIFHL